MSDQAPPTGRDAAPPAEADEPTLSVDEREALLRWRLALGPEAERASPRFGLRGLTPEEMPKLRESFIMRWPTLIPLVLLVGILVSGRTPYLAAFTGISSCAIVGVVTCWLTTAYYASKARTVRVFRERTPPWVIEVLAKAG